MKTILKIQLVAISILLAGCGGSSGSGSSPTPSGGTLSFNKTTISVTKGSTQTVTLSLNSNTANTTAHVDITSANSSIVTISPSTCSLSNSTPIGSSCKVTVNGIATGNSSITATTSGYTSATANVEVSTAAIPGDIVFAESSTPIFVTESSSAVVMLENSSGVASETINFSSSNPSISITPNSCNLSTSRNYCLIALHATVAATATITATSTSGSGESTMLAIASTTPTAGQLVITPAAVLIAAQSGSQSNPATISLRNSAGVHNLWVEVIDGSYNPSIASPGNITQNNIPVGYCCLSSNPESSTCNFNAIGAGTAGSTAISWQAVANGVGGSCPAMGADYSAYSNPALTVTAATIQPTARTFTIVNNCAQTVYFGISGGAVGNSAASQSDCPTNSTYSESKATCFWNNPTPSKGYTLSHNATTTVTIPASDYYGQEWSGGIAGRTNCTESGLCETGGCTGTAPGTGGTTGLACALTHGFSIPNSAAEFTLLNNGNDAYDVTLIGGVIVPVSMQPSNNLINSMASPYQCGNAGSASAQYGFFNGSPQTLYAANWTPSVPVTSGTTVSTPAEAYNYVTGSSLSNTSCTDGASGIYQPNPSACTGVGSTGPVCGYTYDAINQPSPNYKYTCGVRIGWISAATIYAANSTNNQAPFGFSQAPNPSNSNPNGYTIGQWSQCVHPPFDSSYQVGSPDAQTCGGTNWVGIATPESGFMSSNLVWQQEILSRITWIKQACPTCYSYQFDDNSSSFTCQTQASSSNPANATNYTVTFCPAN